MGEGATIEKCLDTRFSLMEWRQVVCGLQCAMFVMFAVVECNVCNVYSVCSVFVQVFPKEWYAVAKECIQVK